MGGNITEHVGFSNYTDLNNGNTFTLAQYGVTHKVNNKFSVSTDIGLATNWTKEKDLLLNVDGKASYKVTDNFSVGFRSRNIGGNDYAYSANRFSITSTAPITDEINIYLTGANTTKFAGGKPTNYTSIFGGFEYNKGNTSAFAELDKTVDGNLSFNVGCKVKF